ncbi:MAG: ion transporter [Emcibacter sp.]|nr:ion transporter [Emcibacter sp.]
MLKQLQHRLFVHLDTENWPKAGLSPLNKALMLFVLLSILSVILETEPDIFENNRKTFKIINSIFLSIFTLEYFLRLWIMGCKKEYRGFYGRLKYIFSTFAL